MDPLLLDQALRTPEGRDVTASPIVRTIVLADPANAADLVPALEQPDSLEGRNALRILCLFGPEAAGPLVAALVGAGLWARLAGLDVLWCLLSTEEPRTVRDGLAQARPGLETLLDDRRPVPDDLPEFIEHDFLGRVCDQAFLIAREMLDPEYDASVFRRLDENGRDQEIARFKRQMPGAAIV
ncbi:MAG TPA: hypothetical protein VEC96_09295 [Anaerolineae bacterium]|nr:hypothetical protein [Anaerolineae bacterium]